ncbi:MAG: oligoendopeptidase F, partial [Firmicutes bacterium]|nr:oligoendopeptidase F [Candidatus Colimorpha enterica]
LLCKTEEELQSKLGRPKVLAGEGEKYKGKLNTAENIVAFFKIEEEALIIGGIAGNYAELAVETDYYDTAAQKRAAKVNDVINDFFSRVSFSDIEIASQSDETLDRAAELYPAVACRIKEIKRRKPHMLSPETEKVLSSLSESFDAPYSFYNNAKLADMVFPDFEANGKTYPLGYSLYEDKYEYEPDTEVRRNAYRAFYDKIAQYKNSTAAAYNSYVRTQKKMGEIRGFDSIFGDDLYYDGITEEAYNLHIDTIMEKLAPHMRKYAELIKKIYGLDRMTYADLKLPIDPDYSPDVTIPEAKKIISEGLSLLGEDYVKMINEAFDDRWFDFAQNQGKCTGGFCSSPYGANTFILMSWCGKMSDVFTAAHELGHAGHFRLCNGAQSVFDVDVPRYFVEAPSTMNEVLLSHSMLKNSTDKRFRRWVLSNMVSNTYYHNFVTHFLEAYYQREVYRLAEKGESVDAETLSGIFRETLAKFWGDTVELTEGAELTWMRQPHYYMGLYSYTYSAGLSIATQMAKRIEKEGAQAVEDWKKVLSAGSTLPPAGLAKLGGIDVTDVRTLEDTVETIGGYIDEIISLTEELENE